MGVRSRFRMTVDDSDGTLYFGDVGPNVFPELKINPLGYDEINAPETVTSAGHHSLARMSHQVYDFENNKVVATFKPGGRRTFAEQHGHQETAACAAGVDLVRQREKQTLSQPRLGRSLDHGWAGVAV